MFSDRIKRGIDKCIREYIPFVVYSKPNLSETIFFSNPSRPIGQKTTDDKRQGFAINLFSTMSEPFFIDKECDIEATLKLPVVIKHRSQLSPHKQSTIKADYLINVEKIIANLKVYGGKTVYSKVVVGRYDKSWSDVIDKYFCSFPSTFRFACYIPETGFWLAATPEILLNKEDASSIFTTMSLAGTRDISLSSVEWDSKNIEEHDIVTSYIVDSLATIGINSEVKTPENLLYGNIEHLCNRIECKYASENLYEVANLLSPTPALAGYPMENALNDIAKFESHPRYCYGGYVAIRDSEGFFAYVNLRCVHFDKNDYCIYGGGGITAQSDAKCEWHETEAKIAKLRDILENVD